MTKNWKPVSFNDFSLTNTVLFTARLRERDDGKPGYRHIWTQLRRKTRSEAGRERHERRCKRGEG